MENNITAKDKKEIIIDNTQAKIPILVFTQTSDISKDIFLYIIIYIFILLL